MWKQELDNFGAFVAQELLDLYQMKDWGMGFPEFTYKARKAIDKALTNTSNEWEEERCEG